MNVVDCRFIYNNFIRGASIVSSNYYSEHPQFPIEYIQDDALALPWRARYGSGTGNGVFVVTTGTNDKIDFDEGGAELTATLTANYYTAQTLATQVKAQLDAAGALTYTVTYSESTGKFTIAATGNFTLRWNTGTNKAVDASDLLGFSDAANETGAATYTSDTVVIHRYERPAFDLGEAKEYDSIALINHNLTSSATITIRGADDSAFTTNAVTDTITHNNNNIFQFLAAARTKQYVMLEIADPANPSGYVQVGCFVVGKYFATSRTFGPYAEGELDETEMEYSPSNNVFVTQERPALVNREIAFKGLDDTSITNVRAMLAECGVRKAVWLCVDSTAANTGSYWVRLKEYSLPRCEQLGYWTWEAVLEERT
jgi:hypothetical protein